MTYAYRLLPGGYVDETGPHRGAPPTEEDWRWLEFVMLHSKLACGVYDAEIKQEMPIEEAKRRWPNTPIPGEEKTNGD